MRRAFFVGLASFLLSACADQTGIMVQITSTDINVPSDVDGLTIRAHTPDGLMVDDHVSIRTSWPQSLLIRPATGEALGEVRITVTGTLGGTFVVQRFVMTQFIPGQVRRVDVQLTRDCLGVMCADDVDCVAGTCQGMGLDGGIHDAGPSDAGTSDVGIDGGSDAAPDDAGQDAGNDAGNDGGHDAAGPCAGASCLGSVVISEMSPAMTNEFVELYNRSGQTADLSGCTIMHAGASDPLVSRGTIAAGMTIPSHGYLLLAHVGYTGSPAPDQRAWSVGFFDTDAAVAIQCGTTVIDLIGYGTGAGHHEGLAFTPAIDTTAQPLSSYERKATASSTASSLAPAGGDATAGNGYDTDDNATNFVVRVARDPQSSASPHEP